MADSRSEKKSSIDEAIAIIHDQMTRNISAEENLDNLYQEHSSWIKENPEQIKSLEQKVEENLARNLTELCKQELSKISFDKPLKKQQAFAANYYNRVEQYVFDRILPKEKLEINTSEKDELLVQRARVMARWIRVANECFNRGDFHTFTAIYYTLTSESIFRLKATIKLLDVQTNETFVMLQNLFKKSSTSELEDKISERIHNNGLSNIIPPFSSVLTMGDLLDSKSEIQAEKFKASQTAENPLPQVSSSTVITTALSVTPDSPKKNVREQFDLFLSAYKEMQKNTVITEAPKEGIQNDIQKISIPPMDDNRDIARDAEEKRRFELSKKLEPKTSGGTEKSERAHGERMSVTGLASAIKSRFSSPGRKSPDSSSRSTRDSHGPKK